jgi:dipeptidyl aminopeptidase/acylaminoacyl peptidase
MECRMKKIFQILCFVLFFNTALADNTLLSQTLSFKRISQVQVSPDGNQVAYILLQMNPSAAEKKWEYTLYIQNKKNQPQLLFKNSMIASLNWSADGKKLSFIAPGKKNQSIWIADILTHQNKLFLETEKDIQAVKWSPDGKWLAFVAEANIQAKKGLLPIDVSRQYKNAKLFRVSVTSKKIESLTADDVSISQSFADLGFDWSPDSENIVFAYQPRAGAAFSNASKISLLNLKTKTLTNLPYTNEHSGKQPMFSHDGKKIAFRTNLPSSKVATLLNNDVDLQGQICVFEIDSKTTTCLANTFNESPVILGWDSTDKKVIVLDVFKTQGFVIYALDQAAATIISSVDGFIEPLTIALNSSGTQVGFGYETVNNAPEVFTSSVDHFQLQQISQLQTAHEVLGKTETINWKSSDGMNIEGLLITPANYDPAKKYPLLVTVHGGPAGTWWKRYLGGCDEYGAMIDPTTCWGDFLKQGFVIFAPNPRGSTGYGTLFRLANFEDFGGGDYRDVMTGVDELIKNKIADPDHLAIAGWSFGGYMTMWAISQSNRFKTAIAGDGNTDFISFSGTSDIPDYYVKYLGKPFWEDNHLYLQRAPISFVKNIQTPLLILSGEKDNRVPVSQSYEMYTALNKQNKEVKMLIFPEQGHLPTDANIIYESMLAVDEWLKKTF